MIWSLWAGEDRVQVAVSANESTWSETSAFAAGVGSVTAVDPRPADFKLLLPAGPGVRALIAGQPAGAATAVLAAHFGASTLIPGPGAPRATSRSESFDVVVSGPEGPWDRVKPGGVFLQTFADVPPPATPGFELLGRWRAWPDWPSFRLLVPTWLDAAGLAPFQALARAGTRIDAPLGVKSGAGLQLERRLGAPARAVLLEELLDALAHTHPIDRALLYSGRNGEENPVLAFLLEAGGPEDVVKVSRFPGLDRLADENERIEAVVRALGPSLAHEVIAPHGAARRQGHAALVFRFVASEPLHGPMWRLMGRRRLLCNATAWLSAVARETAHRLPLAEFEARQVAPLRRLIHGRQLPESTAVRAKVALHTLEEMSRLSVSVLEHGDFGLHNLRLRDGDGDFGVLDWGSSHLDGIPGADLCHLLATSRTPPLVAAPLLRSYLKAAGLAPHHLLALWFAYVGRRWEELDRERDASHPLPGGRILLATTERVAAFARTIA